MTTKKELLKKASLLKAEALVYEDIYNEKDKKLHEQLEKDKKVLEKAELKYKKIFEKYHEDRDKIYKEMKKAQSPIYNKYCDIISNLSDGD